VETLGFKCEELEVGDGGLRLGDDAGCFAWGAVGRTSPDFFASVIAVEYDEPFVVLAMRVAADIFLSACMISKFW
jgi:hypothetical protein